MKNKLFFLFAAVLALALLAGCGGKKKPAPASENEGTVSVVDPAGNEADTTKYDPASELVSVPQTESAEQTAENSTAQPETQETTEPTEAAEPTQTTEAPESETQPGESATVNEIEDSTAAPAPDASASEKANAIARLATDLIGTGFEMGAAGPDAFDNSGFVYYCCRENGVSIPRRTGEFASSGDEIGRDDLLPGDIVIFSTEIGGEANFAGIYIGNGAFVSCNTTESPTDVHSLTVGHWADRFICGRRIA